jgi:hypothetical protein
MTTPHMIVIGAAGAIALMLSACASPVTLGDDHGEALAAAKAAQRAYPESEQPDEPIHGLLDGRAANFIMKSYVGSFDKSQSSGQSMPSQSMPGDQGSAQPPVQPYPGASGQGGLPAFGAPGGGQ